MKSKVTLKEELRILIPFFFILCVGTFFYVRHAQSVAYKPAPAMNRTVEPKVMTPVSSKDLLAAVNAERAKYNVAPLTEDPRLDASAQAKACDEYNNHYFGHVSPSGIRGDSLAENAMAPSVGYFDENLTEPTPVTTVQAMYNWDNSKIHHDGIINPHYTLTGFGICGNEVVEHFYGA